MNEHQKIKSENSPNKFYWFIVVLFALLVGIIASMISKDYLYN